MVLTEDLIHRKVSLFDSLRYAFIYTVHCFPLFYITKRHTNLIVHINKVTVRKATSSFVTPIVTESLTKEL